MIVKKNISLDTLLSEGKKLDYALIYRISEVLLLPAEQLEARHLNDECQEARIFSESEEYHYFELNGDMRVVHVKEEDKEDVIERKYELTKEISIITKTGRPASALCVKSYIEYDDDGQAFTKLTRLAGIE